MNVYFLVFQENLVKLIHKSHVELHMCIILHVVCAIAFT